MRYLRPLDRAVLCAVRDHTPFPSKCTGAHWERLLEAGLVARYRDGFAPAEPYLTPAGRAAIEPLTQRIL